MQSAQPKQYLPLCGRALLEHSLAPFLASGWIDGIVVVLAATDAEFSKLPLARHWKIHRALGGATRAESVSAGLEKTAQLAPSGASVNVLVHDAARPCVTAADLARLRDAATNEHGALLAHPVTDTVKRAEDGSAAQTVDRRGLWRAQTPQLFRLDLLQQALNDARSKGGEITDEASAMEQAGYRPQLVATGKHNLKVTVPEDFALAEFWLKQQETVA